MRDRLWGLPPLLIGLYLILMPRERFRRDAERDARRAQRVFPWVNERMISAQVRQQMVLRWLVPPIFIVFGALTLLGLID